ncbi:MAG: PIG-L deacetylase family protein [Dehalococcoidia bacterium]
MEEIETPERAMLVIPHPDDGESGCAGTVAKWAKEGCHILHVVTTNGDKGTDDREMTREKLAAIREKEQRRAAEVLGVEEVVFLGYGDGELEDTKEFRGQIVRQIRRWKPDVVFAMDPMRHLAHSHRDHRISGQVALDACYPFARDFLHYPEHAAEGFDTHKTAAILLWGSEYPDVIVDISETVEQKMQALAAHESQLSTDMERVRSFVMRRSQDAAERAAAHGHKVEHAEVFRRIKFRI